MVKAYMAQGAAKSEWVDQKNSPLGRRRHCDLAREKKLPSVKDGRRVLIKRSDIDAYLKSKQVVSIDEDAEFEAEAKRLAAEMGDG
ncbi:helix-turn-helix domain-containing protein [Labilithrix luteola]|nr:helix-turn-helix domain-containing protein [Labilithrix luteola]